jgi:transcriptional regulator with XRE-family HTH domain
MMKIEQTQPKTVGWTIRNLRKQNNLRLEDVATKAKISVPYLSQIERGRSSPSEEIIRRLAASLNVSVAYLMGERRNNSPDTYPVLQRWTELFDNPNIPKDLKAILEETLNKMLDAIDFCIIGKLKAITPINIDNFLSSLPFAVEKVEDKNRIEETDD